MIEAKSLILAILFLACIMGGCTYLLYRAGVFNVAPKVEEKTLGTRKLKINVDAYLDDTGEGENLWVAVVKDAIAIPNTSLFIISVIARANTLDEVVQILNAGIQHAFETHEVLDDPRLELVIGKVGH